jgi:hypothetical protein
MRLLWVLLVLALLTRGDELVPSKPDPHAAVTRAIKFFDGSREPDALVWLAWMHKHFGIREFANALQRYDEVLSDQPQQAPLRRVLRRVADRDNPLRSEDWESVVHPSDRITVSALYCDQLGFPASFSEALRNAFSQGGYYFPHVLLAVFWIQQNGCTLGLPRGFVDDVYRANAAIIHNDPTLVTDLTLEAAAFLNLAGQGTLVDDVFLDRVIASQNADGGWGEAPNRPGHSDWHSSVLGLLFLAHVRSRADSGDTGHIR